VFIFAQRTIEQLPPSNPLSDPIIYWLCVCVNNLLYVMHIYFSLFSSIVLIYFIVFEYVCVCVSVCVVIVVVAAVRRFVIALISAALLKFI